MADTLIEWIINDFHFGSDPSFILVVADSSEVFKYKVVHIMLGLIFHVWIKLKKKLICKGKKCNQEAIRLDFHRNIWFLSSRILKNAFLQTYLDNRIKLK